MNNSIHSHSTTSSHRHRSSSKMFYSLSPATACCTGSHHLQATQTLSRCTRRWRSTSRRRITSASTASATSTTFTTITVSCHPPVTAPLRARAGAVGVLLPLPGSGTRARVSSGGSWPRRRGGRYRQGEQVGERGWWCGGVQRRVACSTQATETVTFTADTAYNKVRRRAAEARRIREREERRRWIAGGCCRGEGDEENSEIKETYT
mmetsp:Transcript_21262/g.53571  ORF Transcript_21262/g.53571 Transcript_21262/m.53571 type:complete len:207 (+) Transcript_21262:1902-2522(+)